LELRKALDEWGAESGMGEVEIVKETSAVEEIPATEELVKDDKDDVPF
jgi:hypothetical protein